MKVMHDFLPLVVFFQDASCVHAAMEWTPLWDGMSISDTYTVAVRYSDNSPTNNLG